jgi:hypothetical protein
MKFDILSWFVAQATLIVMFSVFLITYGIPRNWLVVLVGYILWPILWGFILGTIMHQRNKR